MVVTKEISSGSDSERHPGYEKLAFEISTLFTTYPPPFIYVNDPTTPRITSSVVKTILDSISDTTTSSQSLASSSQVYYAHVNGVACFTARLLYDSILNGMVKWNVNWDDGCANWSGDGGQRWNENLDGFLHGLRAVHAELCNRPLVRAPGTRKGKEREKTRGKEGDVRLVIVIERAERLKETLPDLIVPLTRIAELSQVDLSIVFISDVRWQDIRPTLGASPDPYYIDISPPTREVVIQRLSSSFLSTTASYSSATASESRTTLNTQNLNPYHPTLHPLYCHFVSMLCNICFPFTQDPHELQYIAAARWPGFVQPILDDHDRKFLHPQEPDASDDHEMDHDSKQGDMNVDFMPPSEDVRLRLIRLFNPSLTTALETLYPRLTNAADWAAANKPEADILNNPARQVLPLTGTNPGSDDIGMKALPRMSKFILVAAFLASTNPAKSDLRMFGRGLDEKKRRRRNIKTSGKTKGGPAKIPQRLLGPVPFLLDRVIAILGALLEENDADARPPAQEFTVPGEYTDMELGRVGIYASIMELTSMRLLHRTSSLDKIDGPLMFKCGISYDVALALARQLDIPLNNLMWDQA